MPGSSRPIWGRSRAGDWRDDRAGGRDFRLPDAGQCRDGDPTACFDLLRALNIDIAGVRHLGKPHGRNVAFAYKADGTRTRAFPPEIIERIPRAERSRFIDTSLLPDAMERWHEFAPDESDVPDGWWRTVRGI